MVSGGARGFLGIAAFVNPIAALKVVLFSTIGHELPDAASAGAGNRLRLEGAFRLREINEVLRNSLFLEDAADHGVIPAGALETMLDNRASAGAGEKAEVLQNRFVHRER